MKNSELKRMANRLGIPVESLAHWHRNEGPSFGTRVAGQYCQKTRRPPGALSVGDIVTKYQIAVPTLARWRREGLPHRRIGKMIVVSEKDLDEWILRHGL